MTAPGHVLTLTCQQVIERLVDYLDAALGPEVLDALERHLAVCTPCAAYLRTYRRTRELAAAAERVEMPPDMAARLRDRLLKHLG